MRFIHEHGALSPEAIPVIFLPGWGFDGRVLQLAGTTDVNWFAPDRLLDPACFQEEFAVALAEEGIDRFVLAGWSMGAHLALDFARLHPERVVQLYLLSMRQSWPVSEINAIRRDLGNSSSDFLSSFYRKCFLGHREAYRMFETTLVADYRAIADLAVLNRGLDYLAGVESSGSLNGLNVVQLHGCKDLIAPYKERACLSGVLPFALSHVGHPVFLSDEFLDLVARHGFSPRKTEIRKRFSKAAATYDAYSQTQKETALQLDGILAALNIRVAAVLEVGCGTGTFTRILSKRLPLARITSLDFSAKMIDEACKRLGKQPLVSFLCQDGEDYLKKAAAESFDLVTSNATLQWFDDLEGAVFEISRVLTPGGYFVGSLFGPESLSELAQGLCSVWGNAFKIPAAGFFDLEQLKIIFLKFFPDTVVEEVKFLRRYDSLADLLAHMRRTGTTGGNRQAPPALTRACLKALDAWFIREKGGYVLTHQVFLISCRKGN